MTTALLIAHEVLCLLLIYSVFQRFVRTDSSVRLDVRIAFFMLGVAACLGVPAPLVYGYVPDPLDVLTLASFAAVQWVTGRHWTAGVPHDFYKPGCMPLRRACDVPGCRKG